MKVVYHASENKDLVALTPQPTKSRDRYIGNFVFATENKLLAIMYLVPKGYSYLMATTIDPPHIVIAANKDNWIKYDQGGALYELSADTFVASPQVELSDYEQVSPVAVTPLAKVEYTSCLQSLLEAGITVKFVDQASFDNLIGKANQADLIKAL